MKIRPRGAGIELNPKGIVYLRARERERNRDRTRSIAIVHPLKDEPV
jgi:hypothetical protein